jgi:hypothetical protein
MPDPVTDSVVKLARDRVMGVLRQTELAAGNRRVVAAATVQAVMIALGIEAATPAAEPAQATAWRVDSIPADGEPDELGAHYRERMGWVDIRRAGMGWTRCGWDSLDEMRDAGYVLTPAPAATEGGER